MKFFDAGLVIAGAVCLTEIAWKIRCRLLREKSYYSFSDFDLSSIGQKIRIFFIEILGLGKTFKQDKKRWLAHSLIFYGFMGLLLFHALDAFISANVFPSYEPTLNPWQWLRNLLGLMVMLGIVMAAWRRLQNPRLKKISSFRDWAALILIGGICLSGFFFEASKIISPYIFKSMAEDYAALDELEEKQLISYWQQEYGTVFSAKLPADPKFIQAGKKINAQNCMSCHDNTSSAFISRSLAWTLSPVAPTLNNFRADKFFGYIHAILCLLALGLLPFAKFFHVIATPITLLVRNGRTDSPGKITNLGKLAFDACTGCGVCSLECSVNPSFSILENECILPTHKINMLRKYNAGQLNENQLQAMVEGSRICTLCLRCTQLCPAGIDLQSLWMSAKQELGAAGQGGPNADIRKFPPAIWAKTFTRQEEKIKQTPAGEGLSEQKDSFESCIQCTTCTSVCPVVAVSSNPTKDLDLTPQQTMNLLRMGLKEQVLGTRMIWSCTTCYKCQEYCPQNIPVADILYELRNIVSARLRHRNFQHPQEQD